MSASVSRAHAEACRRCNTVLEQGDLRCSVCALMVPATSRSSDVVAKMRVLRCDGCGAAVSYSAEAQAPKCAFCAAVMRVEIPEDPVEEMEHLVPFAVSPDAANLALRQWLSKLGWFRPSDLSARASVDRLRPLFWAAWLVDAHAFVSWTADSNAGSRSADWAPHAGQVSLPFRSLAVPASRGLSLSEALHLTRVYDLASMIPRGSNAPAGTLIEAFDVQRSAARRMVVEGIENTAARAVQNGSIPGNRFRNVRVAVLLESLTTKRVGFPVYIFAYRYNRKPYRAVVHGQNANLVLGTAPYSLTKIALAILGGIVLLVVAVVLLTHAR